VFSFDNTYARELQGFYVACLPTVAPQPQLLRLNRALAEELGLRLDGLDDQRLAAVFPVTHCPRAPRPWRRPTRVTSTGASCRNWATAARSCWVK
jgi:uncharacterized protein YdiU (UPF0061 family)